jgi:fumarylacetoacetate (FAA) hydrolase family protein
MPPRTSIPTVSSSISAQLHCQDADLWTFGTRAVMASLARRGVLRG